ncbi:hypothetical protein L7F22_030811 [Adiantum nelumboides]|nr:hypothetical protein [Adiantum nelumboides]
MLMPQSIVSDRDPHGQSKEANSTVLDLLKCYVSEHKATWEHYLPLVEYAYNNTVHTSTGKAPFEIVEGGKKVPPILHTKDKIFEADKYVQNTDEAYKKIKLAFEKTQSKQKKAADRHRRELVFSRGDWVLLRFEKARLRKMKGKERMFPKLGMRYYEPFQVCDKISDVAYRLKLPEGWKIHSAFHASLLRPFVGNVPEDMVPEEQPEVEELDEILVPEEILAHKDRKVRGKVARRYLVADFGVSRLVPDGMQHVSTAVQGTIGYLDPEYFQTLQLTDKSDVYSFGVMLVELISGLKPVDSRTREPQFTNLALLFINHMQEARGEDIIDPRLVRSSIMAVAGLAHQCLALHGNDRPSMNLLADELRHIACALRDTHYDKDMVADFGVSRLVPDGMQHVSTAVQGTIGYLDPEYFQTLQLTDKSDVYSFGVMLVELISGLKPVDSRTREPQFTNLALLFINHMQEARGEDIIDPRLVMPSMLSNDKPLDVMMVRSSIMAVAGLAHQCLALHGNDRPSMNLLADELRHIACALRDTHYDKDMVNDSPLRPLESKLYKHGEAGAVITQDAEFLVKSTSSTMSISNLNAPTMPQ